MKQNEGKFQAKLRARRFAEAEDKIGNFAFCPAYIGDVDVIREDPDEGLVEIGILFELPGKWIFLSYFSGETWKFSTYEEARQFVATELE